MINAQNLCVGQRVRTHVKATERWSLGIADSVFQQRALVVLLATIAAVFAGCGNSSGSGSDSAAGIRLAVQSVCVGEGAAEAAPYEGGAPHPVVLLASKGGTHQWTGAVPPGWSANSPEAVQLVACLSEVTETTVETCAYSLASGQSVSFRRLEYSMTAVLRAARTAEIVSSISLSGGDAAACPETISVTTANGNIVDQPSDIVGSSLAFFHVESWLERFVE